MHSLKYKDAIISAARGENGNRNGALKYDAYIQSTRSKSDTQKFRCLRINLRSASSLRSSETIEASREREYVSYPVTSTDRADPRMTNDIDGILPTLRDGTKACTGTSQLNTYFNLIESRALFLAKN